MDEQMNGQVLEQAELHDNSCVQGNAIVKGRARLYESWVKNHAVVDGDALLVNVQVDGHSHITETARLSDGVYVHGHATVGGYAVVEGSVHIGGNAQVIGYSRLIGNISVSGNAVIDYCKEDNGRIIGTERPDRDRSYCCIYIGGDAFIRSSLDISVLYYRDTALAIYRTKDGDVEINLGGHPYTIDVFRDTFRPQAESNRQIEWLLRDITDVLETYFDIYLWSYKRKG